MFDEVYQEFGALVTRDAILVAEGILCCDDFADDRRIAARCTLGVELLWDACVET